MLLRLAHDDGVALLKNLVDRDERLERLDLIGEDRLPTTRTHTGQPYAPAQFHPIRNWNTYTFMPAQKAADDLWSHVYTMQLRTCFPTTINGYQSPSNSDATLSPQQPIENTTGHIRLGAVSSITSRTVSLHPESLLNPSTRHNPGKPSQLTNASSLSDIDGQIGLGPARLRLIYLRLARGNGVMPPYRLMVAVVRCGTRNADSGEPGWIRCVVHGQIPSPNCADRGQV